MAGNIMSTGVNYAPLDADSPVGVCVGIQEAQMLAVKVLEYSIRKHTSRTVEIFPLHHAYADFPRDVYQRSPLFGIERKLRAPDN